MVIIDFIFSFIGLMLMGFSFKGEYNPLMFIGGYLIIGTSSYCYGRWKGENKVK